MSWADVGNSIGSMISHETFFCESSNSIRQKIVAVRPVIFFLETIFDYILLMIEYLLVHRAYEQDRRSTISSYFLSD